MKEKIIYRSKHTFTFTCGMFFMRFIFPLTNIMFALEEKNDKDLQFFLGYSAFILAISLYLAICNKTRFALTSKSLIITRTFLKKTSIIYPFSAIKGISLSEDLRTSFKQPQAYTFKIKIDNIIETYKFFELSEKSIERLCQISTDKNSTTTRREIKTTKSISPYILVIIFNTVFVLYFAIRFARAIF